jgi:nifR3 family TIM-barrel protein
VELKPLKIGKIEIGFPVVLAALAGYSDGPYRLVCRANGAPYCATEAMLDRQMLIDGRLRRRLVQICEEDHPVAAQIMGNDPAVMAQAAKVLCEMGFDVIDLNFACPVRKVISRRRGGHMMRQPSLTIEITRAVLDAVRDRPVTLKLRRAYLESDATYEAFWHIAQAAFDAGAAALCVHARSVEQKYMGQADWGFLAAVKRAFPARTIIGSGDVHTAADALKMIEMTGVDGVAAARGAIGNPWLFRQARDLAAGRQPHRPDIAEQRDVLLRHFEMTCQLYGPRRGPKIMRKFGIKYARVHPTPAKVRNAFVEIKSHADWQAVLDQYY